MGFAMRTTPSQRTPSPIGIDLGTTFSRVGAWRDGEVTVIPNDRGKLATPSIVAFTDQGPLVGEAAQEQAEGNMENTVCAPQRLIGCRYDNPYVHWYLRSWPLRLAMGKDEHLLIRIRTREGEKFYRPEEIVTLLLVHLRKTAEMYFGVQVMDAVVTVPARFGHIQQQAIRQACKDANLNVLQLIKSPTAAAISYNLSNKRRFVRNVLICDMGGSYFDFALLTIDDGKVIERAIGTDYVDIDNCILRFCLAEIHEKLNINIESSPLARQRVRIQCERAKRVLSQSNQVRIEVDDVIAGMNYATLLHRGRFDDFCRDDIQALLDPIDWCLEDSGLEKSDVHEVVMVGGSARIPLLQRIVRQFFYGKVPNEVSRPELAVVLGAAVQAAALVGLDAPPEIKRVSVHQVAPCAPESDEMLPQNRLAEERRKALEEQQCIAEARLRAVPLRAQEEASSSFSSRIPSVSREASCSSPMLAIGNASMAASVPPSQPAAQLLEDNSVIADTCPPPPQSHLQHVSQHQCLSPIPAATANASVSAFAPVFSTPNFGMDDADSAPLIPERCKTPELCTTIEDENAEDVANRSGVRSPGIVTRSAASSPGNPHAAIVATPPHMAEMPAGKTPIFRDLFAAASPLQLAMPDLCDATLNEDDDIAVELTDAERQPSHACRPRRSFSASRRDKHARLDDEQAGSLCWTTY